MPVCLIVSFIKGDLIGTYGLRAIRVTATQRFVTDPARVETAIGAGKARRRQYVSG
jgi:hypothetical protein